MLKTELTPEGRAYRNARMREYRRKNRDKINAYQREYAKNHPEKKRQYNINYLNKMAERFIALDQTQDK